LGLGKVSEIEEAAPRGCKAGQDRRDVGTFEQYAEATSIGIAHDNIAIVGIANMTGTGSASEPVRQDNVLWLGSSVHPATPGP
jgi:hypothetical protein